MMSPFRLSSAMKRCARFGLQPQVDVGVLTISRFPSMIGETVRPPCVVNGENSSVMECSHSFLPSLLSEVTRLLTPKTYTLPGSGSAAGDDQAARCAGTSL